jgi:hypothetical protein
LQITQIYESPQRPFHKISITIENHSLQHPWETEEDVYINLLENFHLRRRIYQHAQTLYQSTNGVLLVDHELLMTPLYVVRLSTEQNFTRQLRKRLWKIVEDQERQRVLEEVES